MRRLLPLLALLTACATDTTTVEPAAVTPTPEPTTPAPPDPFVVHEWGTFTSVQSSQGNTLTRMYQEDEPLPAFVHRFQPSPFSTKGFSRTSRDVFRLLSTTTQRMETPVLYFYGQPHPKVRVQVDFPQGIVSEWYPQASIQPSNRSFQGASRGKATWDISLSKTPGTYQPVPKDSIWAPSREVDALTVAAGDEVEPLIFYRGLGSFELPVKVHTDPQGAIHIKNNGDLPLPHVFLYKNYGTGRQKLYPLGALAAGQEHQHGESQARPSPKEAPRRFDLERAKQTLASALTESGLLPKEARAMVNTWERSYFKTPGVRVLYVLPRPWTDKLLPLTVDPKPDLVERVLLGRIEALQPAQEASLATSLRAHFDAKTKPDWSALGPFLLPRMEGLHAAASDPAFKEWLGASMWEYHTTMTAYRSKP